MPGLHSILSPSAAHRWLLCTAAPRLEAMYPESSSSYADEGSLAHAICEKKLLQKLGLPVTKADAEIEQYKDLYKPEMEEYTDQYVTTVWEKYMAAKKVTADAKLFVEVRLDLTDYLPEGFGTSDVVIIADGMMEIVDFKYGKGVEVSAVLDENGQRSGNPQMKIYALGALNLFSDDYCIDRVRMTIVQPRLDNISEFTAEAATLESWGVHILKPTAMIAFEGGPAASFKAGNACRFCKAKARCRALYETAERLHDKAPELLRPHEMAEALKLAAVLDTWITAVKDYALDQALGGQNYPGFKLVEGRSNRVVTDVKKLAAKLKKAGFTKEQLYKPEELLPLSRLESLVGKGRFAEIAGDLIYKPEGAPALVPESDRRKPLPSIQDDFADVPNE